MIETGDQTSVFIQPSVSTRFDTEDVEMVTHVRLRLRLQAGGPEPEFYWQQNVRWWVNRSHKANDKTSIWYEFISDPAPFMVTKSDVKQPVMMFTTAGWDMRPGRFEGTLTVERASSTSPVERRFCLVLEQEDITTLRRDDGWYEWRTDVPGRRERGCYHWYA
ncbi:hypothetical protein AB0G42_33790 [Streptomyces yangpuensis]|uniref:hypothetical protein n=1 Tax=Streptomyces yangpuensis TaxID=1648182 RepID=UPI00343739FB